jgi:chromate transport protein ChrA
MAVTQVAMPKLACTNSPHMALPAGLAATAVALVASAAKGLCTKICVDRMTACLCLLSATVACYYQSAWLFPALIVGGGLATMAHKRKEAITVQVRIEHPCLLPPCPSHILFLAVHVAQGLSG